MTKLWMTVCAIFCLTVGAGSWVAEHSGASLQHADSFGGRARLTGAHAPAMADAQLLMAQHCAGSFEYIELDGTVEFRCLRGDETALQPADEHAAL